MDGFILLYKVPSIQKDHGWKVIDNDSGVMEMAREHQACKEIHIYVKHLVDKPLLGETPNDNVKKQAEEANKDSIADSE